MWTEAATGVSRSFKKIAVLKSFGKFTGKHLFQSLAFNKVPHLSLQLYEKRDSGIGDFL